jgi:hypothetical protein
LVRVPARRPRLWWHRVSTNSSAGTRVQLYLANRLVEIAWLVKGFCKPCSQRLVAAARWLVPEAERYFIIRTLRS